MPVKKYRTLAEAEEAAWRPRGPALWRAIGKLWRFSAQLTLSSFPPGVHKHRSIEDAQIFLERVAQHRGRYT